jgi:serine/threonine-protein kinase
MMAVSYAAKGDSFAAGRPRVWSEIRGPDMGNLSTYDLAPDGKRLAAIVGNDEINGQKPSMHLTFLVNFFDELRRKVPVGK